jgi:SAM-dependent methyltransferase
VSVFRLSRHAPRDYSEQTYASPYRVVSYPHQRRYALALEVIRRTRPATLLDYGAGDGHVLALLAGLNGSLPDRTTLFEPSPEFARIAREKLSSTRLAASSEILETRDLGERRFDLILCLGVLEHMPLPERERFYSVCSKHLTDCGACLIDVPVEVGPSLLVKEAVRVALKARTPEYSIRALLRTAAGLINFDPARYAADSKSTWIHHHTGFDFRLFRVELERRFEVVESYASPFARLPPWLMNQEVFYLIRRRS